MWEYQFDWNDSLSVGALRPVFISCGTAHVRQWCDIGFSSKPRGQSCSFCSLRTLIHDDCGKTHLSTRPAAGAKSRAGNSGTIPEFASRSCAKGLIKELRKGKGLEMFRVWKSFTARLYPLQVPRVLHWSCQDHGWYQRLVECCTRCSNTRGTHNLRFLQILQTMAPVAPIFCDRSRWDIQTSTVQWQMAFFAHTIVKY